MRKCCRTTGRNRQAQERSRHGRKRRMVNATRLTQALPSCSSKSNRAGRYGTSRSGASAKWRKTTLSQSAKRNGSPLTASKRPRAASDAEELALLWQPSNSLRGNPPLLQASRISPDSGASDFMLVLATAFDRQMLSKDRDPRTRHTTEAKIYEPWCALAGRANGCCCSK